MTNQESFKVKNLVTAHELLTYLIKKNKEGVFAFSTSSRIKMAESFRKTQPLFDDFSEKKLELFQKYGEPVLDKDGNPTNQLRLKQENAEFVNKELADALNADSAEVLRPLSAADLGENQIDVDFIILLQDNGLLAK